MFRSAVSALFCALLIVLAAGLVPLRAQEYRGRVQGLVSDPTGAAVTAAEVTLKNEGTGIAAVRKTGENGMYLFDRVLPGTYSIAVVVSGFEKFIHKEITVRTQADVTVDIKLAMGRVTDAVEVLASANTVEFNTATMTQMVSGTMLDQMPVIARSPFTLAEIDPAVINRYFNDRNGQNATAWQLPFYQVGHAGADIGGATGGQNQLLLDGVDTRVEQRGSYAPAMDSVQEFAVQQNPVDAENGNSAGPTITIATKSGTNELHGMAYYYGRNPYFNARSNPVFNPEQPNMERDHIGGGNVGGPVYIPKVFNGKNKAFFFFTMEKWKMLAGNTDVLYTLPTELERAGDFSQTKNAAGAMRVIYDPLTTVLNPDGTTVRTPFAGNKIPQERIDPASAALLKNIWKPNNPGIDLQGTGNYRAVGMIGNPYLNISTRGDYQINDKWKVYGRYSRQNQWQQPPNIGDGSPAYFSWDSAKMYALNLAGNVDGMLSPTTAVNFRFGYIRSADELNEPRAMVSQDLWNTTWPSKWWAQQLKGAPAIYFPPFSVSQGGGNSFGYAGGWDLLPRQFMYSAMFMKQAASHYVKVGAKLTHYYANSMLPGYGNFGFGEGMTAANYLSPQAGVDGDGWASYLLGYPSSGDSNFVAPIWSSENNLGVFVQDDWKVSRNLTVNLGLRWEFDQAPDEHNNALLRNLDLSNPIPEMNNAATAPVFPNLSPYNANAPAPVLNGALQFLDSSNKRIFHAPRDVFEPRFGIAYRIDDKTSVRFGYARYAIPFLSVLGPNWNLPNPGFSSDTPILGPVQGVPKTVFKDPFPAANPIQPPVGASLGRYSQLGNNISFWNPNPKQSTNDRFNLSVQRQLPFGVRLDLTAFMNIGANSPTPGIWGGGSTAQSLNMMDPNLKYTYKGALDQALANPFYNYLTPAQYPGALRYQETVSIGSLLREYPQYGNITELYMPGARSRYRSLQVRAEKSFSQGLGFTFGYNYGRGYQDAFYDDRAQYAHQYTLEDNLDYRHNLTAAPYWEIPVGRGRKFGTSMNPVLNVILGGWHTSQLFIYHSGYFLDFRNVTIGVNGNPVIANPGRYRRFNTQAFYWVDPTYTIRTNPYYFEGLTGPNFWNLDSTLGKNFQINEHMHLELRMDSFNTPNHILLTTPDVMDPQSSQFGVSRGQANLGRQMQYTIRLKF